MEKRQVGTYTLAQDTVFTRNNYETASWWKKIAVKAGEFPVYLVHWYGSRWTYVIEFDGIEVDQNFPSSYAGIPYTSGKEPQRNGEPETYTITWDSYNLARGLLENSDFAAPVKMNPDWQAQWIEFEYEGKIDKTTGMFNTAENRRY